MASSSTARITGRTGRRPGTPTTRSAILDAARARFAAGGFDRTTIRAVGEAAGVDPALVLHYFGNKQRLFLATLDVTAGIAMAVPEVLAGSRSRMGQRLARFVLDQLEDPVIGQRVEAMVRVAATEPAAAEVLRVVLSDHLVGPLTEVIGSNHVELRANLVGSCVAGLVVARRVIKVEPLASLPAEQLANAIGPVLQHYLTGRVG